MSRYDGLLLFLAFWVVFWLLYDPWWVLSHSRPTTQSPIADPNSNFNPLASDWLDPELFDDPALPLGFQGFLPVEDRLLHPPRPVGGYDPLADSESTSNNHGFFGQTPTDPEYERTMEDLGSARHAGDRSVADEIEMESLEEAYTDEWMEHEPLNEGWLEELIKSDPLYEESD